MVDHVRTLLVNRADFPTGYDPVEDAPSDRVMALFGVSRLCKDADVAAVDLVLPLALAPDLAEFRSRFDSRITPSAPLSVYRHRYEATCGDESVPITLDGTYARVLSGDGRLAVSALFGAADPAIYAELARLREASMASDGPYALGAVLLACATRRAVLQEGWSL